MIFSGTVRTVPFLFDIMYVDKDANRLYNKEKIYFL